MFKKMLITSFFSEKYAKTWKYFLRKLILNRIHAQLDDLTHKIIIKEPSGSLGSDIIASCTPNSKIILLLRDGRDVLDSILDALKGGGWETKRGQVEISKEKRLEFLKQRAKIWNRLMKILMKTYDLHPKDHRILIRYEDLRNQTFSELKKIYEFLDINVSEEVLEKLIKKYNFENIPETEKGSGKFKRSATPGKWKESFDDEEKKVIENIIGDTLLELGYQV